MLKENIAVKKSLPRDRILPIDVKLNPLSVILAKQSCHSRIRSHRLYAYRFFITFFQDHKKGSLKCRNVKEKTSSFPGKLEVFSLNAEVFLEKFGIFFQMKRDDRT